MTIFLVSQDEKLAKLVRESLLETFGSELHFEIATRGQLISAEDLCVWDFIPEETEIPHELDTRGLSRHVFLLNRQHQPVLEKLLGTADLNVLWKPLETAPLCAYVRSRAQVHDNESAEKLRIERDEMLQFLIQANLRLQEYDQERSNFLARSIHDFRAPLTTISGYCSLLLEEELGSLTADQIEVLERMQQGAKRLSRITSEMFQLSLRQRVDSELDLKKADMRKCVDQALHEVALPLAAKRISLTVDIELPADDLLFVESQMEQALVNLLDNARKYTPRNGTIEVRGYPYFWDRRSFFTVLDPSLDRRSRQVRTPNAFRLDIRDNGPAIPLARVDKIFEEYSSYSGGQDRSGGGLGLAICRMIVQQHGGRVWAESRAAGAVFCFVLPVHTGDARVSDGHIEEHAGRRSPAGVEEGWS